MRQMKCLDALNPASMRNGWPSRGECATVDSVNPMSLPSGKRQRVRTLIAGDALLIAPVGEAESKPDADSPPLPARVADVAECDVEVDGRTMRLRLPREWVARAVRLHPDPLMADAQGADVGAITVVSLSGAGRAAGVRSPRVPPVWLSKALALLDEGAVDRVRLATVAVRVGVHPVHLSRTFREYFGITPSRYVRELRLERACRAILCQRHSVARVAHEQGFADHGHLTRELAALVGITPSDLRRLKEPARDSSAKR